MTINHDALKKRMAGSRGPQFGWKAKENGNKVRILPPAARFIGAWDQMTDLAITFKIHYFRIEGKQTAVSRCLDELKQRCPACESYRAHKKSTDPALVELAKSVRAADQYLFNILDINNLQAGIQAWPANYTCWVKIMEIAANPAWGNVVDPENGVDFEITMTPGNRSRTGHNQYSVMPSPHRTNVQAVLDAIEDWRGKLDSLDANIIEPKTPEEILELLDEMGLPPVGGKSGATKTSPIAPPTTTSGGGPTVISTPATVSIPGAVPSVPAPTPIAPVPATIAPPTPGAAAVNPVATVTEQRVPLPVHYDPGPNFVEKVPEAQRPANAPRCFGAYAPSIHRCQPCPSVVDCQMKFIEMM